MERSYHVIDIRSEASVDGEVLKTRRLLERSLSLTEVIESVSGEKIGKRHASSVLSAAMNAIGTYNEQNADQLHAFVVFDPNQDEHNVRYIVLKEDQERTRDLMQRMLPKILADAQRQRMEQDVTGIEPALLSAVLAYLPHEQLMQLLDDTLKPRQKFIFASRYLEKMSFYQITSALGEPTKSHERSTRRVYEKALKRVSQATVPYADSIALDIYDLVTSGENVADIANKLGFTTTEVFLFYSRGVLTKKT